MDKKLTFDDIIGGSNGVKEQARSVVDVLKSAQRVNAVRSLRALFTGPTDSTKHLFRVITDQADILVKYVISCKETTTPEAVRGFIGQARIAPRAILCLEQPENLTSGVAAMVASELERTDGKPFQLVLLSEEPSRIDPTLRRSVPFRIALT